MRTFAPGAPAVLEEKGDGGRCLVRVPEPGSTVDVPRLGVLEGGVFEGVSWGGTLSLGSKAFRVLPVTPRLAFETLHRGPQVIRPQDASRIAHECGVGPGATVAEGGVGSGALTVYLAFLVGETGHVHGFDVREDHLDLARRNVKRLGFEDRVSWHEETMEVCQVRCDAFVVDLPEPEGLLDAAERCLEPGGRFAAYTPTVEQMTSVREGLSRHAFAGSVSVEQLTREWVVHGKGARPSFEMLGHTGFLTFATRVQEG